MSPFSCICITSYKNRKHKIATILYSLHTFYCCLLESTDTIFLFYYNYCIIIFCIVKDEFLLVSADRIYGANLEASSVSALPIESENNVQGIAYDPVIQRLFWGTYRVGITSSPLDFSDYAVVALSQGKFKVTHKQNCAASSPWVC